VLTCEVHSNWHSFPDILHCELQTVQTQWLPGIPGSRSLGGGQNQGTICRAHARHEAGGWQIHVPRVVLTRSVRLVPAVPAYSMLRYVIHLYVGPMCMYAIVCVHAQYRMIYDDRCKIVWACTRPTWCATWLPFLAPDEHGGYQDTLKVHVLTVKWTMN